MDRLVEKDNKNIPILRNRLIKHTFSYVIVKLSMVLFSKLNLVDKVHLTIVHREPEIIRSKKKSAEKIIHGAPLPHNFERPPKHASCVRVSTLEINA